MNYKHEIYKMGCSVVPIDDRFLIAGYGMSEEFSSLEACYAWARGVYYGRLLVLLPSGEGTEQ